MNGWNDFYIYILAGMGLASIACVAYIIMENSKYTFNKMQRNPPLT
jgi:hypothetical protein